MVIVRRSYFLPLAVMGAVMGAGWVFSPPDISAQSQTTSRIRFTQLSTTTPQGLKSDLVRDVTQDLGGSVWLATDRGLSRFDGWETVHYSHNPDANDSLSSDQLTTVATTSGTKSNLWIGTSSQGLIKFNQESGKAASLRVGYTNGGKLLSDHIVDLAVSEDQYLWIGTDEGLNVLNLTTENIVVAEGPLGSSRIASITSIGKGEVWVGTVSGDLFSWNSNDKAFTKFWSTTVPVTAVARDSKNRIWIGTAGNGLFSFSADSGTEPVAYPFREKNITSLFVDSSSDLWVGTMNGLALFDRGNDSFIYFNNNPRHGDSLTDNHVSTIFEDRSRMLWVATYAGGTSRFNLDRQWFSHLRYNPENPAGLPHSAISTLSYVPGDGILIGTERGLARWNTETSAFKSGATVTPESSLNITAMLKDRQGNLWMGTRGGGLVRRSPEGSVRTFIHDSKDPASLAHDNISSLFQDSQGRLFVGTLGGGLWQIDPAGSAFSRIDSTGDEKVDFINFLAEDAAGNLWVTSPSQAFILPKGAKSLATLGEVFPKADKPTSNRFTAVLPDSNGIVWIGSLDAGLDRFNTRTGEITNFNNALNRLPDDMVVSLIKDNSNFLWVATRTGIARLNSMQSEFRLFSEEDGLQKDGFNLGAAAKDDKGILYFGGLDGLNIIDPAKLPALPRTPNPMLTSFEYFGEPVAPQQGGILEREIAATDVINIPYDQRLRFAFRFANLDYRGPNRGFFRYMLDGYEYEWQTAGDDRKASYSNLRPGKYLFKVQSSLDGENFPDVTAKVRVVINPPWWQTWWAKTLAFLAVIALIVSVIRFSIQSRVKQMHRHEEMLTAQRDKAEAALARQLQNRMLLERTTKEFSSSDVREDQILSDALHHITEQFGATHCLVQRIVPVEDEEGIRRDTLKQIGYYSRFGRNPNEGKPTLPINDTLAKRVLRSDTVLSLSNVHAIPDSIKAPFPENEPITILAAKTSFRDVPNGLVLLLRVGSNAPWSDDDIKLLEALTGQFGISIAQIDTAAIEEKYRDHLEGARHHAEVANRAKSDFLAKMTHELRTPLNAIIGFSEILGEDKTLNPKQRETLDIINNSGEHLLDVINEILDLSKIEAGKMELHEETFELVPLLKSVYEMLSMKAEANRIAFNFAAQSNLPAEITTDRSKLRQILINLIGNAIKFTAQGGVSISIASTELSPGEMIMGRFRREIRLSFEIRDTGRGIHADEIGKLFERYSQTESGRRSSEGTGLGLPIAKSFVQLMGGEVEVESVFGEGTTFRFSIKCAEVAPVKASAIHHGTTLDEKTAQRINGFTSPHKEVRILIAEDQPTNRLLLKRILGKAGFVLAEVENGQEAIEKWSQWKPHLILMDEDMPVKKGSEATREIKNLATPDNDTVIVSLTAYALEQARTSAIEAGCSDFVAKPFRSHELFSVISKHLGIDYTFNDAA
jgi:signal transduction histidine kinase/ligand-binding sensor domain-containing protein/CheY-like chemotaxis protein